MIACQVANTGKSYTLTNKQKRSSFCGFTTLAQETGNLALLCEDRFVLACFSRMTENMVLLKQDNL